MTLYSKILYAACTAAAALLFGLWQEHQQMKLDFERLAPPPPPSVAERPARRGGSPGKMAHALQYHQDR